MQSLRDLMPETTAFIDALREAFGAETINPSIRAAVRHSQKTFYAKENGIEVGVKTIDDNLEQVQVAPKFFLVYKKD